METPGTLRSPATRGNATNETAHAVGRKTRRARDIDFANELTSAGFEPFRARGISIGTFNF